MENEETTTVLENEEPNAEAREVPASPHLMMTISEHAKACGHMKRRTAIFNGFTDPIRSPAFRAAEQLHGWSAHESHSAEPLRITREAFLAALEAVMSPDKRGNYTPHTEALAPHLRGNG